MHVKCSTVIQVNPDIMSFPSQELVLRLSIFFSLGLDQIKTKQNKLTIQQSGLRDREKREFSEDKGVVSSDPFIFRRTHGPGAEKNLKESQLCVDIFTILPSTLNISYCSNLISAIYQLSGFYSYR